jgi:hypothetical protein
MARLLRNALLPFNGPEREEDMTGTANGTAKRKGTQALEGMAMARARKIRGLCSACKGQETCLHEKDKEVPVLQCEEFEACDCAPCKAPAKRARCLPDREAVLADEEGSVSRGLCVNCDNRGKCAFPKPPGGVWHCMEYK